MSTKVPQDNSEQEIDIFQLSKSIGSFFDRINAMIFRSIQFFVRNWIIVLVLIVLGFGLGWFLDENKKSFENQIIVTPNFGSVDYLYSKVNLIESKIKAGDVLFLKNEVGIQNPESIKKLRLSLLPMFISLLRTKSRILN